jgi:hypothetical protein
MRYGEALWLCITNVSSGMLDYQAPVISIQGIPLMLVDKDYPNRRKALHFLFQQVSYRSLFLVAWDNKMAEPCSIFRPHGLAAAKLAVRFRAR